MCALVGCKKSKRAKGERVAMVDISGVLGYTAVANLSGLGGEKENEQKGWNGKHFWRIGLPCAKVGGYTFAINKSLALGV